MKRKFAAFDIDGTLGRTSIFLQVVHELINMGLLPQNAGLELGEKLKEYKQRKHPLAFSEYSQMSVDILFNNIHKIKVDDYRKAVDKVLNDTSTHLYSYTRDLALKLKAEGYFLIALSGSEQYSVEKFTKQLGFDLSIGETYHQTNGYMTGQIEEVFNNKDVFLKKYVAEHDLTYKNSYAIGDSKADAKMLELVDNPIAFNPEDRLYKIAKDNGWKIVVERKNVIFELEHKNGTYILA